MSDYIVRAIAADSQIRAFAAVTTETVETARKDHNTSPVATAALGRLLTAGSMMGVMMKGDKDILTLQVKGDGLLQGITVTADSKGRVKDMSLNRMLSSRQMPRANWMLAVLLDTVSFRSSRTWDSKNHMWGRWHFRQVRSQKT